jgi:hypothetical protein
LKSLGSVHELLHLNNDRRFGREEHVYYESH